MKNVPNPKSHSEMLYNETSNTVFYYHENKVVLLLDFSQSTTTVYPGQTKSYIDKMVESVEVVLKNLLFRIKNQFHIDETTLQKRNND